MTHTASLLSGKTAGSHPSGRVEGWPHGRQTASPSLLYSVELLQAKHDDPPAPGWMVPAAQRSHAEAPETSEEDPGGHGKHPLPPRDGWNVPGKHWRHTLIPIAGS
jgi:hypothetical protein